MLNYKKFMSSIPEETQEFVDRCLPYLEYYTREDVPLTIDCDDSGTPHYYNKMLFIFLWVLAQNKSYEGFFSKYGFNRSRYDIDSSEIHQNRDRANMFKYISPFVPDYNDITLYETLTPIDMVLPALNKYIENINRGICNSGLFRDLFPRCDGLREFSDGLLALRDSKKLELVQELEKNIYGNLPMSVIAYLETASKIRSLIFAKMGNSKSEIYRKNDEDIVPLSLFLATFYYQDTPIYRDLNISEQSAIKAVLESRNVQIDKVLQTLSISISSSEVRDNPKNSAAIKCLFSKYYKMGALKDKNATDVTVRKIMENVLDRQFTQSYAIERLLARLNCYVGAFQNFDEEVVNAIDYQRKNYSLDCVKSFYADLSKDVRDFIEFTAKIFQCLIKKMQEDKHNKKLLYREDDADTLALLIASYYYDGDVCEYFKDYGITLEMILKLLNIEVTREEIDHCELDQKLLVDKYKRFVYEGVNKNQKAKNIKVEDVIHNLCNRDFNKSIIIESIFSSFTDEENLESDFLKQLKDHIEKKENMRKMNLTQKLFRDMPVDTMEVLENASRIHNYLLENLQGWLEDDIKPIALLLSIMVSPSNDAKSFFQYQGFTKDKICSYLKIDGRKLIDGEVDVDLLVREYGSYIFDGKNKGKARKDLTVISISQNIFCRDLNNSVSVSRFLDHFGLSYDAYQDFEKLYEDYLSVTKEEKIKEAAKERVNNYPSDVVNYLHTVFKIYSKIKEDKDAHLFTSSLVVTESDLAELSMVLGLFMISDPSINFFKKNGLAFEAINGLLGINSKLYDSLPNVQMDYVLGTKVFANYLSGDGSYSSRRSVGDFAKRIFDPNREQSMLLENVAARLGANYDILKEEVETGKDYELSLTVDDRIRLLSEESIDTLDLGDIKSVLHFGNSLSAHSKYIHDELPKLVLSDQHQASIDTINEIINRVYSVEPQVEKPKKGLFARLFAVDVTEEEPKYVFNPSAIEDLKGAIESNIKSLTDEVVAYDAIRKYIEVYRRKNRSHYIVASDMTNRLRKLVSSLDPKKDEDYERFLSASSQLQIMTDKANRFATTNHLMQQELIKVNQALVNHFVTINALEMARDDLLPLVGSEIAIGMGRERENVSLELSHNVIELFQSLLTRNVEGAVSNMEALKTSSLPSSIFASLNDDIQVYLDELNKVSLVGEKVEMFDMDKISATNTQSIEEELSEPITLNLNDEDNTAKRLVMRPKDGSKNA